MPPFLYLRSKFSTNVCSWISALFFFFSLIAKAFKASAPKRKKQINWQKKKTKTKIKTLEKPISVAGHQSFLGVNCLREEEEVSPFLLSFWLQELKFSYIYFGAWFVYADFMLYILLFIFFSWIIWGFSSFCMFNFCWLA